MKVVSRSSGRVIRVCVATLAATGFLCGVAMAMAPYTVHITVPGTVKKSHSFVLKVFGFSANASQLTVFRANQTCAATAARERMVPGAVQIINQNVVNSYSVSKPGKAQVLGKHYVCAYLTGLPPQSLPRAHAKAAYTVT
jgi:hypothetical protein